MVTGHKGAGKDTFADYAVKYCEHLGIKVHRAALADHIKTMVRNVLGYTEIELETLKRQENYEIPVPTGIFDSGVSQAFLHLLFPRKQPSSMRRMLQRVGQGMKAITKNDDYWCEVFNKQVPKNTDVCIVTDMRLKCEHQWFEKMIKGDPTKYGIVIKIQDPMYVNSDPHITEQEWVSIPANIIYMNSKKDDDVTSGKAYLEKYAKTVINTYYLNKSVNDDEMEEIVIENIFED